jgi:tetratricopeptide (TPR) repeat protein
LLFPSRLSRAGGTRPFRDRGQRGTDTAATKLLWARIKLARGDLGGALRALLEAEAMNPQLPGVYIQIGDTYARLLQWQNAKSAYEKAVALDEDNARAYLGLSTVYRPARR